MSSPRKFRKKPVTIEAMQMPKEVNQTDVLKVAEWIALAGYDGNPDGDDITRWADQYVMKASDGVLLALPDYGANYIEIETLEGTMTAGPGDWIIKGVQGEFYPCRADIFKETYEEADDE